MEWLHAQGALDAVLQVRDGVLVALALSVGLALAMLLGGR